MAQAPVPAIPSLFPSYSSALAPGTVPSMSLPPQAVPAATFPPPLSHARSSLSLSTATPLPILPNSLALDPPPVSSNIRNQILSGMDVDFFSPFCLQFHLHPQIAKLTAVDLQSL